MATEDTREQGRCASWSASSSKRGGRGVRCRLSRLHSGPCHFDDQIEEALVIPRLVDRAELEAAEATAEKLREQLDAERNLSVQRNQKIGEVAQKRGEAEARAEMAESHAAALGDALRFYGDPGVWEGGAERLWADAGGRARLALSESDSNTEGERHEPTRS